MAKSRTKKQKQAQAKRPRTFPESNTPADSLDELLKERYHGAVNIRGIRFQLRYAMLRAVELALETVRAARTEIQSPDASSNRQLQFEGIEDVDVREGPSLCPMVTSGSPQTGGEFTQVKTADSGWSWYKLGEPLIGFLELLRTGAPALVFQLVVDFRLRGDLDQLSRYAELSPHGQREIRQKFVKLCEKVGGTEAEALRLLEQMRLEAIPEDKLRARLREGLAEVAGATDLEALEAYELVLAGRCLAWAAERATITGEDVIDAVRRLREGIAREQHYEAVARRWVGPADHRPDDRPEDFFEGKRVRLGHVVAGLDVPRPRWLERIGQALLAANVCVIRAPSGHGKSTLAYRYAIQHWLERETTVVRSAQTPEEVAAISDYLRFRSGLGVPVRVLIDADVTTRLWPRVAEAAVALGAQVLVTVRTEDWHRFALESLSRFEILEPTLERDEADLIFAVFRERGRIHPTVDSAGWAYERLRAPHLLLEYVYLITHGVMLEERLRDQIRDFRRLNEDPRKAEVLRLASLANALGAPLLVDRLLEAVPLRDDPQDVIGSLVGEYVSLESGRLEALHWVRSEHVARILHEGGIPSPTTTALAAAALVPDASLPFLVANAMRWEGIDRAQFLAGLVQRFAGADTTTLLMVVEGLFESGERDFFDANRARFEDAFATTGGSGVFIVSAAVSPITPYNVTGPLSAMLGDRAGAMPRLQEIIAGIQVVPRGLGRVREFLESVLRDGAAARCQDATGAVGKLLDWCALAGVPVPGWDGLRDRLIADAGIVNQPGEDIADFSQGLFRFDREAHRTWFELHRHDLLPCLQLHADCLTLEVAEPSSVLAQELAVRLPDGEEAQEDSDDWQTRHRREEAVRARNDAAEFGPPTADVEITFAVEHEGGEKPHDQAVRRLQFLRRVLPSFGRYSSRGDYLLPPGFPMPVDDTRKEIPRWHLLFPSDVQKNVVWAVISELAYYPDTFYRLQEAWYRVRLLALRIVQGLSAVLKRAFQGRPLRVEQEFGQDEALVKEFERAAKELPRSGDRSLERIGPKLSAAVNEARRGPDRWINDFQNFRQQFWKYSGEPEPHLGRLAVHNIREAAEALPGMHAFFAALFRESPDYFNARALHEQETRAYSDLVLLVEANITDPLGYLTERPLEELRRRAAEREGDDLARIATALRDIPRVVLPNGIVRAGVLRTTAVGVPVTGDAPPHPEVLAAAEAMAPLGDLIDRIWFVPLSGENRLSGGYQISTRHLREDEGIPEEQTAMALLGLVMPMDVPPEVEALLPPMPIATPASPPLHLRLAGIRTVALMILERRRTVDRIVANSDHPCLVELHRRHRAALAAFETEVAAAVEAVRQELTGFEPAAGPDADTESVADLHAFLDTVTAVVSGTSEDPDALEQWDEQELADAAAAIEPSAASDVTQP